MNERAPSRLGYTVVQGLLLALTVVFIGLAEKTRWETRQLQNNSQVTPGTVETATEDPDAGYRLDVSFTTEDGVRRRQTFVVNADAYEEARMRRTVTVRYLKDRPDVADVRGTTRSVARYHGGAVGLLVVSFFLYLRARRDA
jgi:hypothetical protein